MKKHLIKLVTVITLVAIVGALVFTGCAKEEEVVTGEWQWPERIAIISSPGVGLAATTGYTSELFKSTGTTIRIVPEINTQLRFKWLQTGRFFSGAEGASTIRDVLEATKGYAIRDGGPYQLRTIWAYTSADAGYLVRGDSDLKTIYDIKAGTKFVDLVPVPGYWLWMEAIAAWVGVDAADIVKVPVSSPGAALRAISGGQADALFFFPPTPEAMEAAAAPHGIRWLDLNAEEDPEGAKRFLEFQPTATFGVMSQSPEATGVWGINALVPTMTRAEEDPELVYHFAKWLDENYDLYKDNHMWNQYMTIDNTMAILETWFIPAHDGLIKYLKEKGLWTAAHDVRQAQNIELVTSFVEAYQEAIYMADDQGIAVDPENEEWIELWENYKKQLGLPKIKMYVDLEE